MCVCVCVCVCVCRFLANVDPIDVKRALEGFHAETTLVRKKSSEREMDLPPVCGCGLCIVHLSVCLSVAR